jgi:hypothetical protein
VAIRVKTVDMSAPTELPATAIRELSSDPMLAS